MISPKIVGACQRRWLVLSVVLTLVVAACGGTGTSTVPSSAAPTAAPTVKQLRPVKVNGGGSNLADSAITIAEAEGFFEQAGFKPEFVDFSGPDSVPLLANGSIDVSAGQVSAGLFNAWNQGVRVRIVADKGSFRPGSPGYCGLIIRKDLYDSGKIRDWKDLKGAKLGGTTTAGGVTGMRLNNQISPYGFSEKDLSYTNMTFSGALAALAGGSIDAGVVCEPFLTRAVLSGAAGVALSASDTDVSIKQVGVLFYSEKFASDKEAATSFMVAYLRGARMFDQAFFGGNAAVRERVIEILLKAETAKSRAEIEKFRMPYISPDGKVDVRSLQLQQDFGVTSGLVKKSVDVAQMVDHSFAEAAVKQLPK